ncbi:MAG TPA: FMN-dependent NADH-azoreductase [Verrucomicrobiales bacterium]|jgi:FMN-dependent NADH-azoreductase|nr:FMN-dependent NADH-azoreductase [Verrucomicrobiales bacterium]
MKLLHVDSSILGPSSVSRVLSSEIVKVQRQLHPGLEVVYRDLASDPLQHLSGNHLAAAQGAAPVPGLDIEAGGAALSEFLSADIVVIGAPMYNFAVPSQLKAWIDRLAVAGKTFRYTDKGPEGLAGGRKVFVASSRGGAYSESAFAFLDHQEAYLQAILGFFGISDITFVRAENLARGDIRDNSIKEARAQIAALSA